MTAPFFPASDLSECSAPSASGSLKSSMVVPIAGGAGMSLELRPLPATAAKAMIAKAESAREIAYCFFMFPKLLSKLGGVLNAKISSEELDVASPGLVRKNSNSESISGFPTSARQYDCRQRDGHHRRQQAVLAEMVNHERLQIQQPQRHQKHQRHQRRQQR